MTKTDTSREAVGALMKDCAEAQRNFDTESTEAHLLFDCQNSLRAFLTERDALQARAERAEAGLSELEQIANDEARHAHRNPIQRLTERAERAEAERDAGLIREKDANTRAMQNLRRAEKAEIASKNYAEFNHVWRRRAERAEAGLHKAKARIFDLSSRGYGLRVRLLDYLNSRTMSKNELRKSFDEWESADGPRFVVIENPLAQLDAEPAGVSEPAGVKVKPLEWKDNKASTPFGDYSIHQTPDGYEVIDPEGEEIVHVGFNSDPIRSAYRLAQEFAQTDYEQRILADLEPGQTHREVWEQAKEAAAECVERKNTNNVGMVHPVAASDAAAIRAMPYPGDSQ